ncbi:MAG TPA: hypothetical protein VKA53_02595, partial [Thermoanaerobaculia bacterium]|nr:hypothetical protein [Thermoanaerobaculia bacterium]
AAFRRGDPETRWTDRQPAAILLLLIALIVSAALGVALSVAAAEVGRWRGSLLPLVVAAVLAALAWGVLRRRRWAWGATVTLTLAALIATIALVVRPALAAELAREAAAGQGAVAHFYLARLVAPGYLVWLALQWAVVLFALWRLRGHFRRSLEIVSRGVGGAR